MFTVAAIFSDDRSYPTHTDQCASVLSPLLFPDSAALVSNQAEGGRVFL